MLNNKYKTQNACLKNLIRTRLSFAVKLIPATVLMLAFGGLARAELPLPAFSPSFIEKDKAEKETESSIAQLEAQFDKNNYEVLKNYALIFLAPEKCSTLNNPKTCRVIASNPNLGEVALRQIAEYNYKNIEQRKEIGIFQYEFSKILRKRLEKKIEADPKIKDEIIINRIYGPNSTFPECEIFIQSLLKAEKNYYPCIEKEIGDVYTDGFCVKQDSTEFYYYYKKFF